MSPTEMRPPQQTFLGDTNIQPPQVNMPQGKKPKPRNRAMDTFIGSPEATPGPASGAAMGAKTLIGA